MDQDVTGGVLAGFSLWTLFFGFAFSVFGIAAFRRGKKTRNVGLIGIGIALMVFPYFIHNPWLVFGIGAALSVGAYKIWYN